MALRTDSFKQTDSETNNESNGFDKRSTENSITLTSKPLKLMVETTLPSKELVQEKGNLDLNTPKEKVDEFIQKSAPSISLPERGKAAILFSPRPVSELDAAAVKVQRVYQTYRRRRALANWALLAEKFWRKELDFDVLEGSSVSFFDGEKHETAFSTLASE